MTLGRRTHKALAIALILGCGAVTPAAGSPKILDSDITFWVQDALRVDPRVNASTITAMTSDGIVTLTGSVNSLVAKNYAIREAEKINGVMAVIDKLSVTPSYRADSEIAADVRMRILDSAAIDSKNLDVKISNGVATLTGQVHSWAQVDQAGLLASGVRGIKEVKNDIIGEYPASRNDEEVKIDAIAAINRDVYLTGLPITVTVTDGKVNLTGKVGSAYEKSRAEQKIRWIAGVHGVKNDLAVSWWEKRGARDSKAFPADSDLKREVQAALTHDTRVDESGISAAVKYGVVTLTGSVPNGVERRIAEQDARDVVGVGWVTNDLTNRALMRDDTAIRNDILAQFTSDYVLAPVGVNVKDGVATLTGTVATWFDKSYAGDLVDNVRGIKKVVNDIRVERPMTIDDASIAKKIGRSLEWNWTTFWVHKDIKVKVNDGVVTLNGDVKEWSERQEAELVALRTPGVWAVDNLLTVKGYSYPWDHWRIKEPYIYDPVVRIDHFYYDPWWMY